MLGPRPQRSPLFPYTTLFRSGVAFGFRLDFGNAGRRERSGMQFVGGTKDVRNTRDHGEDHGRPNPRSEEHTSELQSLTNLVCRLLLEKKKKTERSNYST